MIGCHMSVKFIWYEILSYNGFVRRCRDLLKFMWSSIAYFIYPVLDNRLRTLMFPTALTLRPRGKMQRDLTWPPLLTNPKASKVAGYLVLQKEMHITTCHSVGAFSYLRHSFSYQRKTNARDVRGIFRFVQQPFGTPEAVSCVFADMNLHMTYIEWPHVPMLCQFILLHAILWRWTSLTVRCFHRWYFKNSI